jgi:protocatechuate 3,4-dioxygenase beta subunit
LSPWPLLADSADRAGPVFDPVTMDLHGNDLSVISPGRPRAMGQLIVMTGQILDPDGRPVPNAMIELWQANAAGRYLHRNDPSASPLDPNFHGLGRFFADEEGRFTFRTIKPGGYAVPSDGAGSAANWWRPPHLHLSIWGRTFGSRLTTQIYFPGEPLNELDLLLNSIPDAAARDRLVCDFVPEARTSDGVLGYSHDIVLGGSRATPFEGRR